MTAPFLLLLAIAALADEEHYLITTPSSMITTCSASRSMDFQNHTFTLRGPHGSSGTMILRNGKSETGSTDWVTSLEATRQLNLVGATGNTWAVQTFADHVGGSGSYSRLFVYTCRDGTWTELLQAGGEGMKVQVLEDGDIVLRFGLWDRADAHCCPSAEKIVTLRWYAPSRIFEITSETVARRKV